MGTLAGIAYTEIPGSNVLSYTPDGITGRRVFKVAWADRIAFCEELLGYTRSVGHVPSRFYAQRWPDYERLYCQDASIEPIGTIDETLDGQATYEEARITTEYRPWKTGTTNAEEDEYDDELEEAMGSFTQGADFSSEFISVAASSFRYADDHAAIDTPTGILSTCIDHTLTSDQEPEVPFTAIRNCIGKLNDAVWFGSLIGHMLFVGASIRRTITAEGVGAWEISYRFRERIDATWNHVYSQGAWRLIEGTDPPNDPPYGSASFRTLFGV